MININLIEKRARSIVIRRYLDELKIKRCICFTSGNSAKFLREVNVDVISIGNNEGLIANKWFDVFEIAKFNLFDATSGHLPFPLMVEIANMLRINEQLDFLTTCDDEIVLPTGSGETLVCLKMAFPNLEIIAAYNRPDNINATKYNEDAPLNKMVILLAHDIIL
jgi:hypothetical protein